MYAGIQICLLFFLTHSTLLRLAMAGNAVATETKKAHLGGKSRFVSFLFVVVYV